MSLKAELADDPLRRGYASMTDREALASLTRADRETYRDVTFAELKGALIEYGIILKIRPYAGATEHPAWPAIGTVLEVMDQAGVNVLPYSETGTRARVDAIKDGLLAAGIIDQADHDVLSALGVRTVSRAEELGLGRIRELDVARARR